MGDTTAGSRLNRLALQLLGCRVGRRSHRRIRRGQPRRIIDAPRDAEIGQKNPGRLPVGFGQQDRRVRSTRYWPV